MELTEKEKELLKYCLTLAYENISLIERFKCDIYAYGDTEISRNEISDLADKLGVDIW